MLQTDHLRNWKKMLRLLLIMICLVFAFVSLNDGKVLAQQQIVVGSRVEVRQFDEVYKGEVARIVGTPGFRMYFVRYIDEDGNWRDGAFQQDAIRPLEAEYRTWRSKKGNFKIEAKYISSNEEKVTIEKEDGTETEVPIASLSTKDRSYIKKARANVRREAALRGEPIPEDFRSWKSKKGDFSIEARYLSAGDTKVKLEKKDGSEIEVPIERLSTADQKYIRTVRVVESAAPIAVNEALPIDFSRAQSFGNLPHSGEYVPDPMKPLALPKNISMNVPFANGFDTSSIQLLLSDDKETAMVVCSTDFISNATTRLAMFDLRKNKYIGMFPFASNGSIPLGVGANNTQMISMVQDKLSFLSDSKPRVDQWQLVDGRITHTVGVAFGADQPGFNQRPLQGGIRKLFPGPWRNPQFCQAVNEEMVIVHTLAERMLLDVTTGRVIATGTSFGLDPVAFSPNRKYMAVAQSYSNILIIDCETLYVVQEIRDRTLRKLAFSDDGRSLAGMVPAGGGISYVRTYDIESADRKSEFLVPGIAFGSSRSFFWSGNSHFLVQTSNQSMVLDAETGMPLARVEGLDLNFSRIEGAQKLLSLGDQKFLATTRIRDLGGVGERLQSFELPTASMRAYKGDPLKLFLNLQGKEVELDLRRVNLDKDSKEAVRASLEASLVEAGATVVDKSDIKVVAAAFFGKRQTEKYEEIISGKVSSYAFTPPSYEIKMMEKGKSIWEVSHTEEGQMSFMGTDEQLSSEAKDLSKLNSNFLLSVRIPGRIPRSKAWDELVPRVSVGF